MSEKKQQPAYPLRMPAELRERLEEIAGTNKRSLNAEIIARLEQSLEARTMDEIAVQRADSLKAQYEQLSTMYTDLTAQIDEVSMLGQMAHLRGEDVTVLRDRYRELSAKRSALTLELDQVRMTLATLSY